jgi:hypothetical protein
MGGTPQKAGAPLEMIQAARDALEDFYKSGSILRCFARSDAPRSVEIPFE